MPTCQFCYRELNEDSACIGCEATAIERQDAMRDERLDDEAAQV